MAVGREEAREAGQPGSGRDWPWQAMFVLLLAGSVLLGSGSRRYAQNGPAPASSLSPIRSSLPSSFTEIESPASEAAAFETGRARHSGAVAADLRTQPGPGRCPGEIPRAGRGIQPLPRSRPAPCSPCRLRTRRRRDSEQFVRMKLVGANPAAATAGTDPLPGKSNYIMGNDPHQWHTGIPQFAGVRYESVYPGIDLVFYGNQGRLEYDFRVAPGADPAQAELQFDGATQTGTERRRPDSHRERRRRLSPAGASHLPAGREPGNGR